MATTILRAVTAMFAGCGDPAHYGRSWLSGPYPKSRDKRSDVAEGCGKSRLSKTDPRTQSERWVVVAVVDVVVPVVVTAVSRRKTAQPSG